MATNDGGHSVIVLIGPTNLEMAALEQIGPKARRAIRDAPLRISAQPILQQLKEFEQEQLKRIPPEVRQNYRMNFADPVFDEFVARGIREEARNMLMNDCSEQDANLGVTPLVAKISVKSLRE